MIIHDTYIVFINNIYDIYDTYICPNQKGAGITFSFPASQ